MTSLCIKHKCYLNPEKSSHKDVSFAENVSKKAVRQSASQWCENSLATGEDCSSLFRILLRVSSAWRWPFSSQDLVTAGFHMCDNGPLRRKNKMSDMLETNNLDLKSVATMFICENPLSASAELIGTVCSINNSDGRARPTFADFIYSRNCGMTSTTFTPNLVHRSVISLLPSAHGGDTSDAATCCCATHQTDLTDRLLLSSTTISRCWSRSIMACRNWALGIDSRLVSLAMRSVNATDLKVSEVSGYNLSAFSLRSCNPSTAHWIWHCACLMVSDDRCNTCDNIDSSARTSFISNRFPRTPSMKWSYTYRSAHSRCEMKVSVYDWAKNFFVFLQQRCVHVRSYFNNGNAVPMRSGSFSTMGTAFPRVPPRNDPCTLNMSMMTMMMMTMMMLMWWWTEWRSSGTKPYRVRQAARRARYDSGGHRQISHWYRLKSTARP